MQIPRRNGAPGDFAFYGSVSLKASSPRASS